MAWPARLDDDKADLAASAFVHAHQLRVAAGVVCRVRHPARGQASASAIKSVRRCTKAASTSPSACDSSAAITMPSRHALAMQPGAVAHAGLDGVAKGVAKVQDGAQARFALVPGRPPPP